MRTAISTFVLLAAFSAEASAHIDLFSPTPRYTKKVAGANKACPCGVGLSNRLCDVEGDRSDDNRASIERVTSFAAGSTITLRFEEYVGHSGRYRVAIDYEGADLEDFNRNILVDIPDPGGSQGNIGEGSFWEIEVPLPEFNCDKCTLQLVQIMDGNTTDPVLDPAGRSSYYTCADIAITGGIPRPQTDAGPEGVADAGQGVEPGPDAGTGTGVEPQASGSGCNLGGATAPWSGLGLLFFALALVGFRQRQDATSPARGRVEEMS